MNWFVFSLISLLSWGIADLFYKTGTDSDDRYSHLKISVWVGLVMGIGSLLLLPFSEGISNVGDFLANALKYSPASVSYIVSMVIGYAGLRYLEVSIVSPVQNASGAFSVLAMFCFFVVTGAPFDSESFSPINVIGSAFIVVGVILLAIVENRISRNQMSPDEKKANRKFQFGAMALIFPILYCIFDTVGTAADGIILNEETGLGLGEIEVLIIYGFTFFIFGLFSWLFIFVRTGKPYNPFSKKELLTKACASVFEESGQVAYVFAMAKKPMLAAPLIASYCIVSVILSRIFLKEKLSRSQYFCVFTVIVGIVLLGIAEGLAEM